MDTLVLKLVHTVRQLIHQVFISKSLAHQNLASIEGGFGNVSNKRKRENVRRIGFRRIASQPVTNARQVLLKATCRNKTSQWKQQQQQLQS